MSVINNPNSNFHGVEKPKDYFGHIDNSKKSQSQKSNNSLENKKIDGPGFQKLVKTDLLKSRSNNQYKVQKSNISNIKDSDKIEKQKLLKTNDGTDFALRKLSEDFEKQILGIMWNLVFETTNVGKEFQGGIGEEIFHKELVNEMVNSSKTGEMGDIATSIYNDLKSSNELQGSLKVRQ